MKIHVHHWPGTTLSVPVEKSNVPPKSLNSSPRTKQARARRDALRMQLGGKCVLCSNTINLEFDCRRPKGHGHHLLGSLDRIRFYEQEAAWGNLQLLCSTCHRKKPKADRVGKKLSWYYEI